MNHNFRLLLIMLIMLIVAFADVCIADTFDERYESWRQYVLEFGDYAGMELSGDEAQALIMMGPNITHKIITKICEEGNMHMQWALQMLLRRVAGITFPNYLSTPSELAQNRDLACQWDREQAFKKEQHFDELWLTFAEQDRHGEFMGRSFLDRVKSDQIKAISKHGIFALPFCIKTVRDENSSEMFAVFLKVSRRSSDYDLFYKDPTALLSRKEQKLEYIVGWWSAEKTRYINLSALYKRIDDLVTGIEDALSENSVGGNVES